MYCELLSEASVLRKMEQNRNNCMRICSVI